MTDWGNCFGDVLNDEATWFAEKVAPWFGVLAVSSVVFCCCCTFFLLFNYCLTRRKHTPPSTTERACYSMFFFLLVLGVYTLFVFLFLNAFYITDNVNDITNAIESQGGRFYHLSQTANKSAEYLPDDYRTISNLAANIKTVSQSINSTTYTSYQAAVGVRDGFMVLYSIPAFLLFIAFLAMIFRLFFLLRVFTVLIVLFLFLFSLMCITTSLPYSVSNHFCDEFQNFLVNQTTALPASCDLDSTAVNNLNGCLLHNRTSPALLNDYDLEDLLQNIQSNLLKDTERFNREITAYNCKQITTLDTGDISEITWFTSAQIDHAESNLHNFQTSIDGLIANISRCSPSNQTLINEANGLYQISEGFGAILNIVDCGPLSSFYETTVVTTFCQEFNDNLLWLSVYTAAVIVLLIPIAMIAFVTGYRPWKEDEHQELLRFGGEPIYKPLRTEFEPSAPPAAINQVDPYETQIIFN